MNPVVLVVEDNHTLRELLVLTLSQRSLDVIAFADAESAYVHLRAQPVDFIISDYDLGLARWTGVQLFDHCAQQYAGRFVLHTGSHPDDVPRRAGMMVFSKPANLDELVTLIRAGVAVTASPESEVPSLPRSSVVPPRSERGKSPESKAKQRCGTCCCWHNLDGHCTEAREACRDRQTFEAMSS